ncbi:hypothetical protein ES703_45146 [subsurface metagenome]
MAFIPYCKKTLKELGIEDEQGTVDLLKFKEHIEVCPFCKQFIFLLGVDFIDNMVDRFGRFCEVKLG